MLIIYRWLANAPADKQLSWPASFLLEAQAIALDCVPPRPSAVGMDCSRMSIYMTGCFDLLPAAPWRECSHSRGQEPRCYACRVPRCVCCIPINPAVIDTYQLSYQTLIFCFPGAWTCSKRNWQGGVQGPAQQVLLPHQRRHSEQQQEVVCH